MITLKNKEDILKDIDEHLTVWDQKDIAEELLYKYGDVNEFINENADDNDFDDMLDDVVERNGVDYVLDKINDDYAIAEYVANDHYCTQYFLDEMNSDMSNLIYDINHSSFNFKNFLKEVKEDEDLYKELKDFIVEECIKDDVTVKEFLNKVDGIFKD